MDIAHQIEVLSLVLGLSHTRGLGVLLVLHDVNMAVRFCDEIIALHTGNLIVQGEAQAIMTPEALRKTYGIDMAIMQHPRTGLPVGIPA